MTLTQCIIYENEVKKFFKKLLDKLLNQCYSIIAVSEKRWLLTDKKQTLLDNEL